MLYNVICLPFSVLRGFTQYFIFEGTRKFVLIVLKMVPPIPSGNTDMFLFCFVSVFVAVIVLICYIGLITFSFEFHIPKL